VNKRLRVCDLDQQYLLPPSLQDWLPENHLARFVAEVTNELNLAGIDAEYERKDGRGLAAYHRERAFAIHWTPLYDPSTTAMGLLGSRDSGVSRYCLSGLF
jgi:hypothetical protein